MKALISTLIIISLFFSCSKEEEKEERKKVVIKKQVKSKHKDMKEQEVEREIIDINEEGFTVEQALKIDEEIPVMEIIVDVKWGQSEISKLQNLQMVDTIRIEKMDVSNLDLSFLNKMKTVKTLSFANSTLGPKVFKSFEDSNINTINISGCIVSGDTISAMGNIKSLKSIEAKDVSNLSELKSSLKKINFQ